MARIAATGLFSIVATGLTTWGLSATAAITQTPLPPPYNYAEPRPEEPPALPREQLLTLGPAQHPYQMPVYANHKLDKPLPAIRRVIVTLPGARRDDGKHYQVIETLIPKDPAQRDQTLILALEFPSSLDTRFSALPAWRKSHWEIGEKSIQSSRRPSPVSAFQVLDDVVQWLAARDVTPALTTIVLAAHGSGAQLLQRYAILNDIDGDVVRDEITLRYVIANAPSYLYLTNERPRRHGDGFAPYERGICPTYNQYPYGPQQLPEDVSDLDSASLYVRYASRNVTYLLGSADTNPEDRRLDKHCGAEAQSATRLSRGLHYVRYDEVLAHRGKTAITLTHDAHQVVDVGHDALAMFRSQCGMQALFGPEAHAIDHAAACETITSVP